MDPRVAPLAETLSLNTRLLRNCLDGMTEEQAARRPSATTNSAAFIAAHLTDSRFYLLTVLGVELPNPMTRYLEGARTIDEAKEVPALDVTRNAWTEASQALGDRLETMSTAELDAPTAARYRTRERTPFGVLTFLVQHDSYHIGQLALLRRYVGLPAMRYT